MTKDEVKEQLLKEYDQIIVRESNKFCGKGASIVRTAFEAGFERAYKLSVNMFSDRLVVEEKSVEVPVIEPLEVPKAKVKRGKA